MDKADTINFVEIALMSAQLDFFVGAYALRALVFSRPAQCQVQNQWRLVLSSVAFLINGGRITHETKGVCG